MSLFSIVVTLQLTICSSMSSLQYTICRCQGYIISNVKLCQFLQYLPKYALCSSSRFTTLKDQQSGLDMERWLTPWRTSTYERPFTREVNYLVEFVGPMKHVDLCYCLYRRDERRYTALVQQMEAKTDCLNSKGDAVIHWLYS